MYASIHIHDHRGSCRGFAASHHRDDWRIFLKALATDDGQRLIRRMDADGEKRIAVLQAIEVAEPYRGRNIGRQLVADFLRVAAADAVIVAADRSAGTFFATLGFSPCGSSGLMVYRPPHPGVKEALAA
jgi:GNAT superfamily N-acetyltransferase